MKRAWSHAAFYLVCLQLWQRLQFRLDIWHFGQRRAEYFAYLHALLRASGGRITMRELFDKDCQRHGNNSARGRLSRWWSRNCEACGGDLYTTWRGSFPPDELVLVRAAQAFGNARLLDCFQALAGHLGLLIETRKLLWATLAVAALALFISAMLLLALPWWTVPALKQSFQGLPEIYLGQYSKNLFATADFLAAWGLVLLAALLLFVLALVHGMPRWHGYGRALLDGFGPWRLYRQVQAMRLLALMAILLQPAIGGSVQLRPVILTFIDDASPWLRAHLLAMLRRVDQGQVGAQAFDTGLLEKEVYWFLEDMVAARGLQDGIRATHERLSSYWLEKIRNRALVLRWGALFVGVFLVLGIGLWHYAAIDELRRAWLMVQS